VLVIIGWVGDDIIYKITDTICLQRKTIMGWVGCINVPVSICMHACVITLRMVSIKYVLASDRISTRVSCSFNSFNVASMAGVYKSHQSILSIHMHPSRTYKGDLLEYLIYLLHSRSGFLKFVQCLVTIKQENCISLPYFVSRALTLNLSIAFLYELGKVATGWKIGWRWSKSHCLLQSKTLAKGLVTSPSCYASAFSYYQSKSNTAKFLSAFMINMWVCWDRKKREKEKKERKKWK
jgi:hypothetical protein